MKSGMVSKANKSFNKCATDIQSAAALDILRHGQDVILSVTTPIGIHFKCAGKFIGKHSENLLLIETPSATPIEQSSYFQEGFWVTVTAYSLSGEGAIIQFRNKIEYRLTMPFQVLVFKVPAFMKMSKLRRETRYDTSLYAQLHLDGQREDCEIIDLSRCGCRFIINSALRQLLLGESFVLDIYAEKNNPESLITSLQGQIRNLQNNGEDMRYGVEFNAIGRDQTQQLFNKLKCDGTTLSLR